MLIRISDFLEICYWTVLTFVFTKEKIAEFRALEASDTTAAPWYA